MNPVQQLVAAVKGMNDKGVVPAFAPGMPLITFLVLLRNGCRFVVKEGAA